jgi:hypothetical protein
MLPFLLVGARITKYYWNFIVGEIENLVNYVIFIEI